MHFNDRSAPAPTSSLPDPAPLTNGSRVLVWVDANPDEQRIIDEIRRRASPLPIVVPVGSVHELRAWLKREDQYSLRLDLVRTGSVRVVSSRFSPDDGGAVSSSAFGELFRDLRLPRPPLLLHCSVDQAPRWSHEHDPTGRKVVVTNDEAQVVRFGAFEMSFGACVIISNGDVQSVFDAAQTADCSLLLVCASFTEREKWLVEKKIRASHYAQTTGLRVLIDLRDDGRVSVTDASAFADWVHQRNGLAAVAVMALCSPAQLSSVRAQFHDSTKHQVVAATEHEAVLFVTRGIAPNVMEASSSAIAAAAAADAAPVANSTPHTDAAAAAAIAVSPPSDSQRAAGPDAK